MNCKKCGYECNDDDKFCKNCGEKIDVLKLCNNGQKRCKPESKYCPYCGQEFNPSESDTSDKTESKEIEDVSQATETKSTATANNSNMVKCPYCYSDIPRYSKKCPKCGEWLKKDTNLGCYTALAITVFILSLIISFFIYMTILNDVLEVLIASLTTSFTIVFVLWLYFLPAWIAEIRNHPSTTAIFVLNLFLGATGIGWVVAFIWALVGGKR